LRHTPTAVGTQLLITWTPRWARWLGEAGLAPLKDASGSGDP